LAKQQVTLKRHFSKEELIKLCHSCIPKKRQVVGFLKSNLVAPLPILSPVPEKFQRTAKDSFYTWGLEAQPIKWLPAELQKHAFYKKQRGKFYSIRLREEAYAKQEGVS